MLKLECERPMKIGLCALVILVFFGQAIFLQTIPTPGLDLSSWSPEKESFSTEAPRDMQLVEEKKKEKYSIYSGRIGDTFFYAVSEPSNKKLSATEVPRAFARRFVETSEKTSNPGIVTEKFEFKDDENFYHRVLLIATAARHLAFHTVSLSAKDRLADRFFSQLRVDDRAATEPVAVAPESKSEPTPDQSTAGPKAPVGYATGSGVGTGSGSGSGAGPSTSDISDRPKPTIIPYRIKSKPKGAYTDMARFYNLAGTVRVKVTLLASGRVGTVTPISRLPFGLTTNSINAAKAIEFEPKMINGTALSVLVTVEYVFSIY